jgi:uncharacterized protein YegL
MTDKNLTEVAIILDRSGSMSSIREDMEGGFRRFVEDQRKEPGRCVLSLYQFDNEFSVVFEERDVREVSSLGLSPRGSTALLDAVGRSCLKIGERLAKKPEDLRPGGVVVMVITDGHENASKEWTKSSVRQLVERQQRDYNWKFVYLGADMAAFTDAGALGIATAAMYTASARGTEALYNVTSNSIGQYRAAVRGGTADAELHMPKIIEET